LNVSALATLFGIIPYCVYPHRWVRRAESGKTLDAIGMMRSKPPAYGRAPIVTNDPEPLLAKRLGKADGVLSEDVEIVRGDAAWTIAFVVSALVGHDDTKACARQIIDLATPSVPELRKPVQQHQEFAMGRSRLRDVQRDAVCNVARELQIGPHEDRPRLGF
jgi:hypothetical protein